jgi:starvation-inducible DNA-binding protein
MEKSNGSTRESTTKPALATPTDLCPEAIAEISQEMRHLMADIFVLYVKTKNFHWHMSGRHFRDYHLLLDQHAQDIFVMTDEVAERVRKIGGTTLHSIEDITRFQRLKNNNRDFVPPEEMLAELCADNQNLVRLMRATHEVCDRHNDVATASLLENWIDQGETRTWFLFEIKGVSTPIPYADS